MTKLSFLLSLVGAGVLSVACGDSDEVGGGSPSAGGADAGGGTGGSGTGGGGGTGGSSTGGSSTGGTSSGGTGGTATGGTGAAGSGGTGGSDPVVCGPNPTPPGASSCPSICTSCENNVCKIDCIGDASCDSATIDCPPGYACEVTCTGVDACDSGVINCPDQYACTIRCDGLDACGDQAFNCSTGPCTVECGPDPDSCQGATATCGAGSSCNVSCHSGVAAPTVNCGSACGCSEC
jgi:hypothetical protein